MYIHTKVQKDTNCQHMGQQHTKGSIQRFRPLTWFACECGFAVVTAISYIKNRFPKVVLLNSPICQPIISHILTGRLPIKESNIYKQTAHMMYAVSSSASSYFVGVRENFNVFSP